MKLDATAKIIIVLVGVVVTVSTGLLSYIGVLILDRIDAVDRKIDHVEIRLIGMARAGAFDEALDRIADKDSLDASEEAAAEFILEKSQ